MSNTILESIIIPFNFRIKPKQLNYILTWQFTLLWTRRMQTVSLVRAPLEGRWSSRNCVCFCVRACLRVWRPFWVFVCNYGSGPRRASRGSLRVRWHLSVLILKSYAARTSVREHPNMPRLQKTNIIPHRVTFPIIPSGCVCRSTERLTACGISWGQTPLFKWWPFTFRCWFWLCKGRSSLGDLHCYT